VTSTAPPPRFTSEKVACPLNSSCAFYRLEEVSGPVVIESVAVKRIPFEGGTVWSRPRLLVLASLTQEL